MIRLRVFGSGVRGTLVTNLVSWELSDQFNIEGFYDNLIFDERKGPNGLPILLHSSPFMFDRTDRELSLRAVLQKDHLSDCGMTVKGVL